MIAARRAEQGDIGSGFKSLRVWVVSDGRPANENQCLGLAEALGIVPEVVRLDARRGWHRLLDPVRPAAGFGLEGPPWPDLLIAAGRQSVFPALAVKRASGRRTRLVQIFRPGVNPRRFDLIVTPRHDGLIGPNVFATRGALNLVTPARLAAAAAEWEPRLAHLPRPRAAVLIGGSSKSVAVPAGALTRLAGQLAELARAGTGLMVTTSRRTPPGEVAALRAALDGLPAWIWDGEGPNPYFGFLALADAVIVTIDSVNMTSEAATTGKPVLVVPWAELAPKHRRFQDALAAEGVTRPFAGRLEQWSYPPLDDTAQAAARVRALFDVA
jgi:mitochondrial fission protein ELM1